MSLTTLTLPSFATTMEQVAAEEIGEGMMERGKSFS